jgi:hypothetical protein
MAVGIRCADHVTPSTRKSRHYFADSCSRSVGIVRLRTKATEFFLEISCSINLGSLLSRGNSLRHGKCTALLYAWRWGGHFVHTQYASDRKVTNSWLHVWTKLLSHSFSFIGKEHEVWFSIAECQFNWFRRQETFQIPLFVSVMKRNVIHQGTL